MRRVLLAFGALLLAAPSLALQPGASGSVSLKNGAVDVIKIDPGDSSSGTSRAANSPTLQLRRADTPTAQTDGLNGEVIIDDLGVMYSCPGSSCNASGWTRVQNWALMSGALGNSQQVPWSDVGLARDAAGVLRISDASTGRADLKVLDLDTQAVSVADSGNSSAATFNLDPSKSYVEITCSDTSGGCDGTMQETSARAGQVVTIFNVKASAGRVKFADVTNVLNTPGSPVYIAAGQSMRMFYSEAGVWTVDRTPMRVENNSTLIGSGFTLNFSSLFDVSVDSSDPSKINVAPGSQITQDGAIDKADLPTAIAYEDEANSFGANLQTMTKLVVTSVIDCGNTSSTSCRYAGSYSNSADVATKANVSARLSFAMRGVAQVTASTLSSRKYIKDNTSNALLTVYEFDILPESCTTGTFSARVNAFGTWPTGATITIGYTKNESATSLASCAVTAAAGTCTDTTTNTFTQGDRVHFYAVCSGTCTDNTTALYPYGTFLCSAN